MFILNKYNEFQKSSDSSIVHFYHEIVMVFENIKESMKKENDDKKIKEDEYNNKMNKICDEDSNNFWDFFSFGRMLNNDFENKCKELTGYWNLSLCRPMIDIWTKYLEKKLVIIIKKIRKNTPMYEIESIKRSQPFSYVVIDFNKEKNIIIKVDTPNIFGQLFPCYAVSDYAESALYPYNRIVMHIIEREKYFEKEQQYIKERDKKELKNEIERVINRQKFLKIAGITEKELKKEAMKKILLEEEMMLKQNHIN